MNDQTPPDSFDEEPKPKPLDGDREFPTIAQGSSASKFGIFAFLAVGVIAIIFVALDGMEQSAPRELTTPEEIEFRTPTPSGPYIEIEQQAEVPLEQLVPPIDERELYDPLEAQRELQMQQEALRLAREQKKRMEERRRSPQVIFDNSSSAQGNVSGGATSQGGQGSLLGGGEQDPNIAFVNQYLVDSAS